MNAAGMKSPIRNGHAINFLVIRRNKKWYTPANVSFLFISHTVYVVTADLHIGLQNFGTVRGIFWKPIRFKRVINYRDSSGTS